MIKNREEITYTMFISCLKYLEHFPLRSTPISVDDGCSPSGDEKPISQQGCQRLMPGACLK